MLRPLPGLDQDRPVADVDVPLFGVLSGDGRRLAFERGTRGPSAASHWVTTAPAHAWSGDSKKAYDAYGVGAVSSSSLATMVMRSAIFRSIRPTVEKQMGAVRLKGIGGSRTTVRWVTDRRNPRRGTSRSIQLRMVEAPASQRPSLHRRRR